MGFSEQLEDLSNRAEKLAEHIDTEEGTKNALIMPFIAALGYDVFDPHEVTPEFTADVGIKKGEKVDYAIIRDGSPIILVECKATGVDLDKKTPSQLYRYFSVSSARFGVFTNGLHYQFFSDLEAPNKMDARPFLEFDIRALSDSVSNEIQKFCKATFDLDQIQSTASDLKYTKGIIRSLGEEWINPSERFVKLFTKRVYDGSITQSVKEQFTEITKRAFHEFVSQKINQRLISALEREDGSERISLKSDRNETDDECDIVTTEEEVEGYYIVKSIVREVVDAGRIYMRDTKSYCGILLDDNNRKPICRLLFNRSQKRIALFDSEKNSTQHDIQSLNDIYLHAEALKRTASGYESGS